MFFCPLNEKGRVFGLVLVSSSMLVVEVVVVLVLVSTGRLSPPREPPLSFIRHKESVVDWFRLLS